MELQYNNSHEHGRNDQIVSQFLLKSLHIVLESRVPSIGNGPRGLQVKKSEKWFNLGLGERPSALDCLSFWHRNLMEPMIIDIVLVQEIMPELGGYGTLVETVIERWVVQYESYESSSSSYKKTYKKSIILLRSLYTMLRLLPAYRAYRKLSSSSATCKGKGKGRECGFDIVYKVSSFSAPFSRSEEQMMKVYSFVPVEAQHGRLSISVRYRESLSEFNLETSATFPPEIITDYVGSPATDPFRAFPDNNNNNSKASFPIIREARRPHSWSSGGLFHPSAAAAHQSSSVRYDPSSYYDQRSHRAVSFDDSPPFSPSPPTYNLSPSPNNNNYMQSRLRGSETAPVTIPNPRYQLSPNLSDPSRHSLPPLSPRSTRYDESSPSATHMSRSLKKSDMSRVGGDLGYSPPPPNTHKVVSLSRGGDDSGRFSGLLSSSGSPRIGFSRSSSLQDDLDDIDFSCPFIVDDVDSPLSLSQSGVKKSQDAAVGALVRMLRTAPPLRQDSSSSSSHHVSSGGLYMSRMTSDALEDLKAYTDIKHLILSKSKQQLYTL